MILSSQFPKKLLSNAHWETIVPRFFRKEPKITYQRKRLELTDGDFLDLDWVKKGHKKLVIFSHGLEGCSRSKYILSAVSYFSSKDYDCLSWNCRGCSGETNRLIKMYNAGASEDFKEVIGSVIKSADYSEIYLVGFSMGGNITLKYLAEEAESLSPVIKKAVAVSAPLSLEDCAINLSIGFNKVYVQYFLKSLIRKLKVKSLQHSEFNPDFNKLKKIKTFREFDSLITAPLGGFLSAEDYWARSSSYFLLDKITLPTLIINAENDPFLAGRCYPLEELEAHKSISFEMPMGGGHVGFMVNGESWAEKRTHEFISEL